MCIRVAFICRFSSDTLPDLPITATTNTPTLVTGVIKAAAEGIFERDAKATIDVTVTHDNEDLGSWHNITVDTLDAQLDTLLLDELVLCP